MPNKIRIIFLISVVFVTCLFSATSVFAQGVDLLIGPDIDADVFIETESTVSGETEIVPLEEETPVIIDTQEMINEPIDFEQETNPVTLLSSVATSVFDALKELGVNIKDGIIRAVKIVVEEVETKILRIAVEEGKDNVIGSGMFPPLSSEILIRNSLVEANSKIFISFASDTGGRTWYISEKIPGYGFKLSLNYPTPKELYFDYWIVLIEEQEGDIPGLPAEPAPYCGDGKLYAGEECDDGNLVDGDGCDSTCMLESLQPSGEGEGQADQSETTDIPTEDESTIEEPTIPMLPIIEDAVSSSESETNI